MNNHWRQFIKKIHPEGIPWPFSVVYNVFSTSEIFQKHYELVAHDVAHYGAPAKILDIGTGPGHLLLALHKVLPEAKLTGVDISSAMIAQARQNLKKCGQNEAIDVRIADASALPFANETFNCVVSTGSFHHWKEPIHAMAETYRVLKPGGIALIYDLVRKMPKAVCNNIRTEFGSFRLTLLCLHSFEEPFMNAEEMENLGSKTDFAVEGTVFVGALCCLVLRKATIQPI